MKLTRLTKAQVEAFPEGAIWNAFVELLSFSEADELGPEQLPAFRAYWYDSEVLNGGHLQYFLNRGLTEAELAVPDLETLGYHEHSRLLARAVAIWRASEAAPPETVEQYVERADEGDFDELDDLHAQIRPGILDRLEEYLDRHQDHFVIVDD